MTPRGHRKRIIPLHGYLLAGLLLSGAPVEAQPVDPPPTGATVKATGSAPAVGQGSPTDSARSGAIPWLPSPFRATVRAGTRPAPAPGPGADALSRHLTLDPEELGGTAVEVEGGVPLTERLEASLHLDHARASERSEYDTWEGEDGRSVEQETRLRTTSVGATLRIHPFGPGEGTDRPGWIPDRLDPFVGGGGGLLRHRVEQEGEFVDFQELEIRSGVRRSAGWDPFLHGTTGMNVALTGSVGLVTEVRYRRVDAELDGDFSGSLELNGLEATAGAHVRF